MISLYKASDYTKLALRMLDDHLTNPLDDPFSSEWIVVQNFDQATWLQLTSAKLNNISANNTFLLPSELFWTLYRKQDASFPKTLASDRYSLQWAIYALILEDEYIQNTFSLDKKSIEEDIFEKKCWKLSESLADVFDQYQIFRPQLVNGWEQGVFTYSNRSKEIRDIEAWQSYLWNQIISKETPTRGHAYESLLTLLETDTYNKDGLPLRISIFGANDVSPSFHRLIKSLSKHVDIHYYVKEEGHDEIERLFNSKLDEGVSNAEIAFEFFQAEKYVEENTVRHVLPVSKDISINCCHSSRREIQELKRDILSKLDDDQELHTDDILIVVPDLDIYVPYLREEFGLNSEHSLPVSFPAEYHNHDRKVFAFVDKVLSILGSRYEASSLLEIFSSEFVRKVFSFSDEDISTIRRWVSDNHIHWGLNEEHTKITTDISLANHTWRNGITKIILGSVTAFEEHDVWKGLVAYPHMHSSHQMNVASKLSRIFRLFEQIENHLKKHQPIQVWLTLLSGIFRELLDEENARSVDALLNKIGMEVLVSEFENPVSYQIISDYIRTRSFIADSGAGAFGRGVLVSSYIPIQTIPFKYIAILGLNEGVLPHKPSRPHYDLMQEIPEVGDRDVSIEDHDLFMNLYGGATSYFYTSFVGFNEFDEAVSPPSIFLQYMIDYFEEQGVENVVIHHRLQSFSSEYQQRNSGTYNYSLQNEAIYKAISNDKAEAYAIVNDSYDIQGIESKFNIANLYLFFNNSYKYLCTNGLNINVNSSYVPIQDEEAIQLDGLQVYQLQQLLKYRDRHSFDEIVELSIAIGILPSGKNGALALTQIEQLFLPLWAKINSEIQGLEVVQKELSLHVAGIEIHGTLHITEGKLIHVISGRLKPKHIIKLWIEYLFALNSGLSINSAKIYYVDKGKGKASYWEFGAVEGYKEELTKLLSWKEKAMNNRDSLVLFEQASFDYFKAYSDPKTKAKAFQKAMNTWVGNAFSVVTPESQDYYYQLVHGDENPLCRPSFTENAIRLWEPIFRFKREGVL